MYMPATSEKEEKEKEAKVEEEEEEEEEEEKEEEGFNERPCQSGTDRQTDRAMGVLIVRASATLYLALYTHTHPHARMPPLQSLPYR